MPIPDAQILHLNPWWRDPDAVGRDPKLCFWKSGRGTEIDYVVAEEAPAARGGRFPVEVKGDSASTIANARRSISPVFGRGIIVTNSRLDLEHEIPAVPAPLFLAALRERPERKTTSL